MTDKCMICHEPWSDPTIPNHKICFQCYSELDIYIEHEKKKPCEEEQHFHYIFFIRGAMRTRNPGIKEFADIVGLTIVVAMTYFDSKKTWQETSAWQKLHCYPVSLIHCSMCGMYPRNGIVGFSPYCCDVVIVYRPLTFQRSILDFQIHYSVMSKDLRCRSVEKTVVYPCGTGGIRKGLFGQCGWA